MAKSILDSPPSRKLRALLRLPIWLYRIRLGWLLGDRFLLLQHTGRKSGRVRKTMIEVVKHDPSSDVYYVVSGWGPNSDWYLNIKKHPLVVIRVGARHIRARALDVPVDAAADILEGYSKQYPLAFRELTRLFMSEHLQPGHEAGRRLAARMPMVAFRPVQDCEAHP